MTTNQLAYLNLQETARANQAREAETNRSNVTNEHETHRHNLAGEALQSQSLQETFRHNWAQEGLGLMNLAETNRANEMNEYIKRRTLAETFRSNLAHEAISQGANEIQDKNVTGSLDVRNRELDETARHNKVSDYMNILSTVTQVPKTMSEVVKNATSSVSSLFRLF